MEPGSIVADEIMRLEAVWSAYSLPTIPIVLADAEGASLWDVEGHRALDFLCADAGVILGHRHPALIRALEEQSQRITLAPLNCFHTQHGALCRRLALLTGFDLVETFPSASQTCHAATTMAHLWGVTQKSIPVHESEIIFSDANNIEEVEAKIGRQTVAVFVNLLPSARPLSPPPENFFERLSALSRKENFLLIVDESQTSLGRSGSWLLCHQFDVRPDMICLGEEVGGGIIPQSALLLQRHVFDKVARKNPPSAHARSPLAAAIGLSILETIEFESLALRAESIGKIFRAEMEDLVGTCIANVQGVGTVNSIELLPDVDPAEFCNLLASRGLLAQPVLSNTVRFSPPLTLTNQELKSAIAILRSAVGAPR